MSAIAFVPSTSQFLGDVESRMKQFQATGQPALTPQAFTKLGQGYGESAYTAGVGMQQFEEQLGEKKYEFGQELELQKRGLDVTSMGNLASGIGKVLGLGSNTLGSTMFGKGYDWLKSLFTGDSPTGSPVSGIPGTDVPAWTPEGTPTDITSTWSTTGGDISSMLGPGANTEDFMGEFGGTDPSLLSSFSEAPTSAAASGGMGFTTAAPGAIEAGSMVPAGASAAETALPAAEGGYATAASEGAALSGAELGAGAGISAAGVAPFVGLGALELYSIATNPSGSGGSFNPFMSFRGSTTAGVKTNLASAAAMYGAGDVTGRSYTAGPYGNDVAQVTGPQGLALIANSPINQPGWLEAKYKAQFGTNPPTGVDMSGQIEQWAFNLPEYKELVQQLKNIGSK